MEKVAILSLNSSVQVKRFRVLRACISLNMMKLQYMHSVLIKHSSNIPINQ